MENDKKNSKLQIILAIIAFLGIVIPALLTNWDRIFATEKTETKNESIPSILIKTEPKETGNIEANSSKKTSVNIRKKQSSKLQNNLAKNDSIQNAKEKEIAIYIIGQTYRRAFALNFRTRFATKEEYESVLNSITDAHGKVQAKYVELLSLKNQNLSIMVYNILKKLDDMESTFQKMKIFVDEKNPKYPMRLDFIDDYPDLKAAYDDMESVRIEFKEDIRQLADKFDLALPDVPSRRESLNAR